MRNHPRPTVDRKIWEGWRGVERTGEGEWGHVIGRADQWRRCTPIDEVTLVFRPFSRALEEKRRPALGTAERFRRSVVESAFAFSF